MKWYWVRSFKAKSHIIPESLLKGVCENLQIRGIDDLHIEEFKENDEVLFDLPGMIMMNRNIHTIDFYGIKLAIPSTDVSILLTETKLLPERVEIGQPYYKLHGFLRCLCLTPDFRNAFINALTKILSEATVIANMENEEFNKKLLGNKEASKYLLIAPRPVKNINKGQT